MEDTVKALEEEVGLLEAKLGTKNKSTAGASNSSSTTSTENPRIKPKSFSVTSGESWVVWIHKFRSIAALNKWSPELVEQTCYSLTAEQKATWAAVERAMTD